ncbi:Uncharacterised protein [Klebsiella quasipneumoniae]|uniref:hypothetical protein n=1 Tax=Klebsiella quasipneumoniae TaxID=1463165 RepID=UPI0010E15E60|nr:Uncharacterised protein [Klebsiella quasipneumoniae]
MTITLQAVNEIIASLESAGELSIKETKVMALAKAFKQLAAENSFLMHRIEWPKQQCPTTGDVTDVEPADFIPATDRIVAGIKADGRAEGINFAAGRLAAAFNHGFVDKPMAEVFDVVRMILTAKEDLANDPAADGLSGEYAEKSLAEWEAALREGADK